MKIALKDRRLDDNQTLFQKVDSDPEAGTIRGTAAAYNVDVDRGGGLFLRLLPGCFSEQVPHATRVKVLWQHQHESPIGKLTALKDSSQRLTFEGLINDNDKIPTAELALALLRDDVLDEVSVGFQIKKTNRPIVDEEADTVTFEIVRAHLREVSVVTFGAMGDAARVKDVFERDASAAARVLEARRIRAELGRLTA